MIKFEFSTGFHVSYYLLFIFEIVIGFLDKYSLVNVSENIIF